VCNQLYGDGQGDRCSAILPPDEGTADQGCVPADQEGYGAGSGDTDLSVPGV